MAARDFCSIQGDEARQRRATLGSITRLPPVAAISRVEEVCKTSGASGSVVTRRLSKPWFAVDAVVCEKIRGNDAIMFGSSIIILPCTRIACQVYIAKPLCKVNPSRHSSGGAASLAAAPPCFAAIIQAASPKM